MKMLASQLRNPPLRAALFWLALMDVVRALDITLPTEADLQAVEYNNTPQNTGNGTGIQINARWADTVNEVIALRFNLTAYDRSQLSAASLNLINYHADGMVTIIISAENSSTTQLRFASRETTFLGTGDGSLLGNDLSDPDSNIDDSTLSGAGFNWLNATASGRAFFGTGIQAGFASIL